MKFLVVLAVAVACAAADVSHIVKAEQPETVVPVVKGAYSYVQSNDYLAPIVKASYDISPEGNAYQYAYETGNGISAQAEGVVKHPESDVAALEVKGYFKYTSPDGTPVETTYVADEYGFHPTGSHIPVAPPVPEAIARALAYIAAHQPAVVPGAVEKGYKP